MIQLLTRNLGWKLVSLSMAVLLWLAVAREPEVATSLSAPVEYKNMRDDLDIQGSLPDRVRLEVRGPSGSLTRDNLASVAVILDLGDAKAGDRTYTIRDGNVTLPYAVAFYRAVPSQLTLHFVQLVAKDEPVEPVALNVPTGYRIFSEDANPARVRIRGSADRVESIQQVKTDPIDLTGMGALKTFHTHLNIGDPQVRLIDAPSDIAVRVKLEKITGRGGR